MGKASERQPAPVGSGEVVLDRVIEDLRERAEEGKKKYGTLLRTGNGRDALWDAYQEALDLVMYLRQELLEKEGKMNERQRHQWAEMMVSMSTDYLLGGITWETYRNNLEMSVRGIKEEGDCRDDCDNAS